MYMRFRQLGAVLVFCLAAAAQTQTLTLDQLMKFLSSSVGTLKMSDSEIAKFLSKARLSERFEPCGTNPKDEAPRKCTPTPG